VSDFVSSIFIVEVTDDDVVYSPYMLTIPQQVAAVMRRKVQILTGDSLATGMNLL
jgi:hypothetical protein